MSASPNRRARRAAPPALVGVLVLLAAAPAGALAAQETDPSVRRDWGEVTGYVLGRPGERPVAGARVVVEDEGAFAESGRSVGRTDKDGRYCVRARIGRKSSNFDVMSLIEGFPIALVAPWGLFRHTRVVDAGRFLMQVAVPSYKPFLGMVAVQAASARRYAVHNVDILLAPEGSSLASSAPRDRPRERLLASAVSPAIASPGAKVTFTARFRLPQDGIDYAAGWNTPDDAFADQEVLMRRAGKPDPATGAVTFEGSITIPRRPTGDWAVFRLWLDRERRYNEVGIPGSREALVQVAAAPEARPAAEMAREAFALEQQHRPAEALERYRKAAEAAPARASLWARIGEVCLHLNRPAEAVAAYEKHAAATPDQPALAASRFAAALLALGEPQRALDVLTDAEKKTTREMRLPREFFLALARTYLAREDLVKADSYYARALKTGRVPQDLAQQFHLERARAAVNATPRDSGARAGLARALFDMKRYDEAAAEYRQAIENDPRDLWACLDLGNCLAAAARDREALPYFRQAVGSDRGNLEAHLTLAECSRRAGCFAEALEAYRRVAASPARSADFRVQHGLGLMLLAAGHEGAAREALAKAVLLARKKGRPGGARVVTAMGVLPLTAKKVAVEGFTYPEAATDAALLDSLRRLAQHPDSAAARYAAGAALIELGLAEKGLAWLNGASAAGFRPAEARCTAALALLRLGRHEEARRELEAITREDPGHRGALLALARLAFDEGDIAAGQGFLIEAGGSQ